MFVLWPSWIPGALIHIFPTPWSIVRVATRVAVSYRIPEEGRGVGGMWLISWSLSGKQSRVSHCAQCHTAGGLRAENHQELQPRADVPRLGAQGSPGTLRKC